MLVLALAVWALVPVVPACAAGVPAAAVVDVVAALATAAPPPATAAIVARTTIRGRILWVIFIASMVG